MNECVPSIFQKNDIPVKCIEGLSKDHYLINVVVNKDSLTFLFARKGARLDQIEVVERCPRYHRIPMIEEDIVKAAIDEFPYAYVNKDNVWTFDSMKKAFKDRVGIK